MGENLNSLTFIRPLGYESVYLPLHKVADTRGYKGIQGDDMMFGKHMKREISKQEGWSDGSHYKFTKKIINSVKINSQLY